MIIYDQLRDELYYSGNGKHMIKIEGNELAQLDFAMMQGDGFSTY